MEKRKKTKKILEGLSLFSALTFIISSTFYDYLIEQEENKPVEDEKEILEENKTPTKQNPKEKKIKRNNKCRQRNHN